MVYRKFENAHAVVQDHVHRLQMCRWNHANIYVCIHIYLYIYTNFDSLNQTPYLNLNSAAQIPRFFFSFGLAKLLDHMRLRQPRASTNWNKKWNSFLSNKAVVRKLLPF